MVNDEKLWFMMVNHRYFHAGKTSSCQKILREFASIILSQCQKASDGLVHITHQNGESWDSGWQWSLLHVTCRLTSCLVGPAAPRKEQMIILLIEVVFLGAYCIFREHRICIEYQNIIQWVTTNIYIYIIIYIYIHTYSYYEAWRCLTLCQDISEYILTLCAMSFFFYFCDIWWWIMKYDETRWNMMKYDEIWWKMMKYDGIWWNMVKHDEIWWNMMKYDEIWCNMMKYDEIWGYCDAWWYFMTRRAFRSAVFYQPDTF